MSFNQITHEIIAETVTSVRILILRNFFILLNIIFNLFIVRKTNVAELNSYWYCLLSNEIVVDFCFVASMLL